MPRGGYSYYHGYSRTGDAHNDRILRAFEQPLQLMQCRYFPKSAKWELQVSSSTGSGGYELNFNQKSGSCNCPDFERRKRPCKHMLCVLLRVLKIKDQEFTTVTQVGKSYDEITATFLRLFHHQGPAELEEEPEEEETGGKKKRKRKTPAKKTTKKGAKAGTEEEQEDASKTEQKETAATTSSSTAAPAVAEEQPAEEEMCIICLLEFQPAPETIYKCSADCQRWLGHKECLNAWFQKSNCCPLCKGIQRSTTSSSSSSAWKRSRYDYDDDNVDINELQDRVEETANPPTNAFFEIVRE
jgi:hypothetical protein